MRTFKKLLAVFLALTVLAGMLAMPVSAATVVQDGLEVTLSTDRESYARGDSIEVTLTVTNTGDTPLENVAMESVIPEGYRLEESSEGAMLIQSLAAGQTVTLPVRLAVLPGDEETEPTAVETEPAAPGTEPVPPVTAAPGALVPEEDVLTTGTGTETSEDPENPFVMIVWIVLAAAAAVLILLLVLRGKKGKRAMCLLLCGAMLSSLALGNPVRAAQSDEKTVRVRAEISVEGQSVTLEATVTYQLPQPETTVQAPVGHLVTFESNGGSRIPAQAVAEGSAAVRPGDPTRDGSVFGAWYADQELTRLYDFTAPVTGDLTLYASWTQDPAEPSVEDDDGDGIPNLLETLFELSDETNDTDGDGIDDYTEIFLVGSDPSVADSSQDKDGDGLSNYDEVILLGTDATLADTDRDGLPDGEEVTQTESGILVLPGPQILGPVDTNPLLYDTDGDGLRDGMERQMGTDPKVPDPFFHTSATAENTGDTVTASVSVDLSGVQVETLQVQPVDSTLFSGEMPGYLGKAYDFTVDGEFETATICFEFDPVLLADGAAPKIFYFNEEDQSLEELETTITGNVASTVVEHFSTYILLDSTAYYDSFSWEDVWEVQHCYDRVEIVLVIDDSGSLGGDAGYDSETGYFTGGTDPQHLRLAAARNFIDMAGQTAQIGIVKVDGLADILSPLAACDEAGKDALKDILQITPDIKGFTPHNARGVFDSRGTTYLYAGLHAALGLFSQAEEGDNSVLRTVIVFTDGDIRDGELHESAVAKATGQGIRIYTVGMGESSDYFTDYLQPLAESTGGSFYPASDADRLAAIYEDIGSKLDLEADADGDGIPDFYEDNMIAFNGTPILLDKNNPDTDGDNVPDGEEIEVELVYNEDGTKAYVKGKMWSDPTMEDTDYDGVSDDREASPAERMDTGFNGAMVGYYTIADAAYTFDYRAFFADSSVYIPSICTSSLMLANNIYEGSAFRYDFGQETVGITDLMEYHGFTNVIDYRMNEGCHVDGISVDAYTDDDVSEIGIGYRHVTYQGTTRTVLGIVIRGTNGTVAEWSSNFDMGNTAEWDSQFHKGFYLTEERIKDFVAMYVDTYLADAGDIAYWITGHSRGAALSNILAARLIDEGKNVYAYTFATPATTIDNARSDAKYNSIFNFANTSDFVTYVPLAEWNFGCYGITKHFSIEDAQLQELWCAQTGAAKYNAMNKNVITLATQRITKSCCASWDEYHDRAGAQDIDDKQYGYISHRALRYCDLKERFSIFGNHAGYKLYPSTAFIFQLGAEMLGGSVQEQENVQALIPEFWNSKYAGVILLFIGDAAFNMGAFDGLEMGASLVGDGHAPGTYYILIQNS